MIEKSGTLLDRVRGVSTKIRGIGNYLISSLALAGTLAYSNPVFAQEQSKEQPASEEKKEEPKEEAKPEPKKEKDIEVGYAKPEPRSYFNLHLFGGASPNNENQGAHAFTDLNASIKDMFKFNLFDAYKALSIEDENGIRTIINSPFNTKADLFIDTTKGVLVNLGFRGSLEERIRRITEENFTTIGTANITTLTRTKTVDVVEHYGGLIDLDFAGSFWLSFRPYRTNKPTITTHELYQEVNDVNPAASFKSNFEFRDPTPRIKDEGFIARFGHTRWFNTKDKSAENDICMVTDLVGSLNQETIDVQGSEKRRIQNILVGADVYLAHKFVTPRIALLKGFFDESPASSRHSHGPNATKFFASGYFDISKIDIAKKVKKSEDPTVDSVVERTNIPLLVGGSYSFDKVYGPVDRITRQDGRLVLGIGYASGPEALKAVAAIEDDLLLKDLGLRPEEGDNLSALHSEWKKYTRPFLHIPSSKDLDKNKGLGLLLTGRFYNQRINGNNGIGYEGDVNLILKQLVLRSGLSYDELSKQRVWNAGIAIPVKDWVMFNGQYSESNVDHKREGTYSFGVRVNLVNEMKKE